MPSGFLDIAATPSVRAAQARMGADRGWQDIEGRTSDRFTDDEAAFIASRDSFYMATISETGWPYLLLDLVPRRNRHRDAGQDRGTSLGDRR